MGQFCLSDIVPYHVPILLKTANGISCKSISPKFENWILEDAKTRKPLLIGTRSQILDEYDRRNKSL